MKGREFLDSLSNYQRLKQDSGPVKCSVCVVVTVQQVGRALRHSHATASQEERKTRCCLRIPPLFISNNTALIILFRPPHPVCHHYVTPTSLETTQILIESCD